MDKRQLWKDIEKMKEVAEERRGTMESLGETIRRITFLYGMDKNEAFEVLAIMQSLIFVYTLEPSEDEPSREDIFAKAEGILDKQSERLKKEREGKSE